MELTQEERNILAHIVVDPDAWVAHALATVDEPAVLVKINKYRADYLAKKDLPNYMNRAERDVFELAEIEANKPIPTYEDLRRAEMPSEHELIVALWEKVIEGRPEATTILQAKREATKIKYSKP